MRFIAVACITTSIIIPIHAAENATDKALNAAGAIDFNQPLTTFTGKPLLQRGDCPPPKAGQDDTCDQVITTLGDLGGTAIVAGGTGTNTALSQACFGNADAQQSLVTDTIIGTNVAAVFNWFLWRTVAPYIEGW